MPYRDPEKAREKQREYSRRWREKHPEQYRAIKRRCNLKAAYGMTPAEFDSMLEQQGGGCAICGATDNSHARNGTLCVDHDHGTNLVRGILCGPCNLGLGKLGDTLDGLMKAVAYLKNHHSSTQDPCPESASPPYTMPAPSARVQMVLPLGLTGASTASCASGMSPPLTKE